MNVLIVGGGKIGMEKLQAILAQSPATQVRLVAISISEDIKSLARNFSSLELIERAFLPEDVHHMNLVLIAINDRDEGRRIGNIARRQGKLVNVADKPEECDFYMGSIVKKGNLKLAISTNGKSPTIAKRLRELFNELLPEELDEVLDNMQRIRNQLTDDFQGKVERLNLITKELAGKKTQKKTE